MAWHREREGSKQLEHARQRIQILESDERSKIILPPLSFSPDSGPVTLTKMMRVKINTKYPQRRLMQLLT